MNDPIYHVSPDGQLALTVLEAGDGEVHVCFHGFEWYTPASLLAEISGLKPERAVEHYIEQVLQDNALIAVLREEGEVRDVWVTDAPESDLQHQRPGESIEFRYWSGVRK
jgi:hypothetical protein